MTLPSFSIRLPCAWYGKITPAIPVIASGYRSPVMIVSARRSTTAGRISFNMGSISSREMQRGDHKVDGFDPNEWDDHAAYAIDPKVAPQQRRSADRSIFDAL